MIWIWIRINWIFFFSLESELRIIGFNSYLKIHDIIHTSSYLPIWSLFFSRDIFLRFFFFSVLFFLLYKICVKHNICVKYFSFRLIFNWKRFSALRPHNFLSFINQFFITNLVIWPSSFMWRTRARNQYLHIFFFFSFFSSQASSHLNFLSFNSMFISSPPSLVSVAPELSQLALTGAPTPYFYYSQHRISFHHLRLFLF